MDKKIFAKLAILAQKDPAVAQELSKQATAVSDAELEKVAGGDVCWVISCVFNTDCSVDTNHTNPFKRCKAVSDDSEADPHGRLNY